MLSVFAASMCIIHVVSQKVDCDYGYFASVNNECLFPCFKQYDSLFVYIDQVTPSSLSFRTIKDACPNVDAVAKIYGCTIDNLVWPQDTCDCPYCRYESLQETQSYTTINSHITNDLYTTFHLEKGCYDCTFEPTSDLGTGDLVYQCNATSIVSHPYEWDHFKCPPETCVDSDSNYWFVNDSSSIECDTLCHCSGTQGKICLKGWSNITSNPTFVYGLSTHCLRGTSINPGLEGVK